MHETSTEGRGTWEEISRDRRLPIMAVLSPGFSYPSITPKKRYLRLLTHVKVSVRCPWHAKNVAPPNAGFTTVQLWPSDQALYDECWRKKKRSGRLPLFFSEGLDETLLTTKSIQTENADDQSQQEDVPSKGEAEPVGLVGGNKNKENKDGGLWRSSTNCKNS